MTDLKGGVALVTGGARGNGRALALAFARAGAAVTVTDIARELQGVPYKGATSSDLETTQELVEEAGGRCLALTGDVRSLAEMEAAVARTVETFGGLDYVVANAGIFSGGVLAHELSEQQWGDMIDINVTGVWNTVRAAIPALLERGSGVITLIGSGAALGGISHFAHYVTAKHAVIGLMRALAVEYGSHGIRANAVCPTAVDTAMTDNDFYVDLFGGGAESTKEQMLATLHGIHSLPVGLIDAEDVANAVVWLCSTEARYITGTALPVDAGAHSKIG